MGVINFLWNTLLILVLFIALMIVIVGGLWVLRVAVDWAFNIDYVERLKQWVKKQY